MDKNVVLDLDDCLADFREPMCTLLRNITRKDIHWHSWDTYNVGESFYGITGEEFCDSIIEHNILENLKPHSETKSILLELKKRNYNLIIISARGFHPFAYDITRKWFVNNDLLYDEIIITEHGKSKADYIKDRKISLAIDDNIMNCESFIDSGKCDHVLLYDMPWNKNSEISRIKTLNDIYCYI